MDIVFLPIPEKEAEDLKEKWRLSRLISVLLAQKNLSSEEALKDFFWDSPLTKGESLLSKQRDKAARFLLQHLKNKSKIRCIGDNDVDGISGVVMLFDALRSLSANIDWEIPERWEGYGLNEHRILKAKKEGVDLIIGIDCGSTQYALQSQIITLGMECLLIDHHPIRDKELISKEIVWLHPDLQEDSSDEEKQLTSGGLVYLLLLELYKKEVLRLKIIQKHFGLVGLSIAGDIAKLTPTHRRWLKQSLYFFKEKKSIYAQLLFPPNAKNSDIRLRDLVFSVVPLLNAAGRVGDASHAVRFLCSNTLVEAKNYHAILRDYNKIRKEIQHQMEKEAYEILNTRTDCFAQVLVLKNGKMGMAGILASKIAQTYQMPTVVLCPAENGWVGSARSYGTTAVIEMLTQCESKLNSFGGHPQAAGLTVKAENVEEFTSMFTQLGRERYANEIQHARILAVNLEINWGELTRNALELLYRMEPFGRGNMRPIFCTKEVSMLSYTRYSTTFFRCELVEKNSGIVFPAMMFSNTHPKDWLGQTFNLYYSIQLTKTIHSNSLELQLDIKFIEPRG